MSVARDGILAQTGGINVTSQNVAGANTPGYVKRTATLESRSTGGVQMTGVTRSFDRFTFSQLVDQEGRLASARARATALADVEVLASPATNHIGDRADELFDALQGLALHPGDTAVRSAVLSKAQWLASGFSETANGLEAYRGEMFTRARDVAGEVNQRLDQLALADKGVQTAISRGEDASDLMDRRDQIVREIGERVGGRVVRDDNGGFVLFGAGTVLYENGNSAKLSVSVDTTGNLRVEADRGGNMLDVTKSVDTGTLAGVKTARDVDVPAVMATLDAFAKDFADKMNSLHAGGVGLDGSSGQPLFTVSATTAGAAHSLALDPALVGHPERLAASSSAGSLPGGNDVAAALAGLATKSLGGAGGTAAERFAGLANQVGVMRNVAANEESMREDTVATASALRESSSGVSTDEEMINLQQFQRAFEASSKVLRTVDELFDTLMQAL